MWYALLIFFFLLIIEIVVTLVLLLKHISNMNNNIQLNSNRISDLTKDIANKEAQDDLSRTRIELMMLIMYFPGNKADISKLAKKYFVELNGDSYMYKLYLDWLNGTDEPIQDWFLAKMAEEEQKK